MGVYIKGMEIPISCANCPLRCYDRDDQKFCGATGNAIRYELSRPENCPLIEIPEPHGRLGDLDAIEKQIDYMANLDWNKQVGVSGGMLAALEVVEDAPTVIPAEEGE